jgi:hypothetical protein
MLRPSLILRRNGAHLTKKNDVLKKTQRVTIALNMQKDS